MGKEKDLFEMTKEQEQAWELLLNTARYFLIPESKAVLGDREAPIKGYRLRISVIADDTIKGLTGVKMTPENRKALDKAAWKNLEKITEIFNVDDFLKVNGEEQPKAPTYTVHCRDNIRGSAAVFTKKARDFFLQKGIRDAWLIPLSIHEMIVIPYIADALLTIISVLKKINADRELMSEDEVLGTEPIRWSFGEDKEL